MKQYKAVLFAPDGDWVTDFHADTKEEVMEMLADKGSRWFFYPLEAVILHKGGLTTSRQRLVDAAYPIKDFKGRAIRTVSKYLNSLTEEEYDMLLEDKLWTYQMQH